MLRIPTFLRTLRNSIAFRLTLTHGLLTTITTLALLAFIHLQINGVLHSQVERLTAAQSKHLLAEYERTGRQGVIDQINITLARNLGTEPEVYLYLDENGARLAGNMATGDNAVWSHDGISRPEARILRDGIETYAGLQVHNLPDGSVLMTGRELHTIHEVKVMISHAGLAAILVAILLIGAGSYIFRQELELRVGTIRRLATQISAGQFKRRISTTDGDDEFTNLNRDINHMLDRIESLMQGIRHVTDTVAHNLRTPMTRILGRLRTAQRPGTAPAEVLAATQYAIQEIENLTNLFDKLLHIAEIESGTQRQNFSVIDLQRISTDVFDLYEPLAEDRGLRLSLHAPQPVHITGDPDLLASAIANIVDNALKYAHSRVSITVTTLDRTTSCVRIEDDGPGIPADEYGQIGRYFYRLNTEKEGYGLGLSSVLAIAKLHNGKLELSNASPGLVVMLRLPGRQHGSAPTFH